MRIVCILFVVVLSASLWLALSTTAFAEEVSSFTSDIVVEKNGDLTITETIVYDFGNLYRHGMYRQVSDAHAQSASTWYKQRYIEIEPVSVTRDGVPEPYIEESYSGMKLRIGDPDKTITGSHTYTIVYTVRGALSVFPGLTELYWNVTGNEWEVPIRRAEVVLRNVVGVTLTSPQACYVGAPGSTERCEDLVYEAALNRSHFRAGTILPGQEFTIAQALVLPDSPLVLERTVTLWFWLPALLLWLGILVVWIYRWRVRYYTRQSVIPQYEPYQGFKPMFTGVLFDNRLDPRDITAGILYLAQQGYIKIKQTTNKVIWVFETKDYEITLLRDDLGDLANSFDDELLSLFFGDSLSVGQSVTLSSIRTNVSKQTANQKLLKKLRKGVVTELTRKNFLEQRIKRRGKALTLFVSVWLLFFASHILTMLTVEYIGYVFPLLLLAIVLPIFILVLFGSERRTKKGFEALWHLKGFKDFLSVTDKERFKFHDTPAKNPQQFMEYLPYAIAFGVEKEWAKAFADITIPAPDWYESDVPGATFSAAGFTADLGAFATSFSSSTGSSGSSGGGSAGGGSGGGGGGSW